MPPITIRSKTESFRRAGLRFTRHGMALDPETLTEEQAKAIFAEPNLVVRIDTTDLTQEQVDAIACRAVQPAGGVEWVGDKKPSHAGAVKEAGQPAEKSDNTSETADTSDGAATIDAVAPAKGAGASKAVTPAKAAGASKAAASAKAKK